MIPVNRVARCHVNLKLSWILTAPQYDCECEWDYRGGLWRSEAAFCRGSGMDAQAPALHSGEGQSIIFLLREGGGGGGCQLQLSCLLARCLPTLFAACRTVEQLDFIWILSFIHLPSFKFQANVWCLDLVFKCFGILWHLDNPALSVQVMSHVTCSQTGQPCWKAPSSFSPLPLWSPIESTVAQEKGGGCRF